MNEQIGDMNLSDDLIVQSELPLTRKIWKKRMFDEICKDEIPQLPIDKFGVNLIKSY